MDDSTKRIIRTLVQTIVSVASVLLVIVPIVLETFEKTLSSEQYAILAAGAASVVAVAGTVARVMQSAPVVGFIDSYLPWLSASSRPEPHVADDDSADAVTAEVPVAEDDALIEG